MGGLLEEGMRFIAECCVAVAWLHCVNCVRLLVECTLSPKMKELAKYINLKATVVHGCLNYMF